MSTPEVHLIPSSPEACPLSSRPTGGAAGGPVGPGAPGAAGLGDAAVVGAGEHGVCAAAVVAVDLVCAARRPALAQRVHTVTLPQLHTHAVLLQLTCAYIYTHVCVSTDTTPLKAYWHAHTQLHTHVSKHTQKQAHTRTRTGTNTHTHTHEDTCTHTV